MRGARGASRKRGFTIIEVMVALLVVAIALPALLKALYQQVDGTAYLRDKAIAQWVASNRMAEVRIRRARTDSIFAEEQKGVEDMADRDWYWWMTSEVTAVEDFYRVEITVATAEAERDTPVYTLVGFVHARNVDRGAR